MLLLLLLLLVVLLSRLMQLTYLNEFGAGLGIHDGVGVPMRQTETARVDG